MDKEILEFIKEFLQQKAKRRETVAYSEIIKAINKHFKEKKFSLTRASYMKLSVYLHELCKISFKERGYMIGALVVRKDKNIPSNGFFKFAKELGIFKEKENKIDFWKKQLEKIFEDFK